MFDIDKYSDKELLKKAIIFISILLISIIALGVLIHNQEQTNYNNKIVECGGVENVEEHFSQVDQIIYYTCKNNK